MKLSVIVVNYKSAPLTKACLESVLRETDLKQTELIVVDNGSGDDSVLLLQADFPEANVLANSLNTGYAGGVNTGIAAARGDYYLILNPDTIVLPGAIATLVRYMDENPAVGLAGGKLISPNGHLQYSCYRFYRPSTIMYRRTVLGRTRRGQQEIARFLMKEYDRRAVQNVEWLQGACLIARAKAVGEIGGMDKRFFLYFEDVDWCRRFWEGGWKVTFVPTAVFSHYHQRSSEQATLLGWLFNRATREHVFSAMKYFWKYRGKPVPLLS